MSETLTNEVKLLREQLAPVLKLMAELERVRAKQPTTSSGNLSWLGLLTSELRDEALKDTHSTLRELEGQILGCTQRIDDLNEGIEDSVSRIAQRTMENSLRIDRVSGELLAKAPDLKLEELKQQLRDFKEDSKEALGDYVTCEEFERAKGTIKGLAAEQQELTVKLKEKTEELLECAKQGLAQHKLTMDAEVSELEKTLRETMERKQDSLRNAIEQVADALRSEEILRTRQELATKTETRDSRELTAALNGQIRNSSLEVLALTQKLSEFGAVLERFDELLLEKLSKDDFSAVHAQLPLFQHKSEFNSFTDFTEGRLLTVFCELDSVKSSVSTVQSSLSHITTRFEGLRRENYEISSISRTFQYIKEELAVKAEKIDVFAIYDVMGKREELTQLREDAASVKQQLEINTVLLLELTQTLLKDGETRNLLLKRRLNVCKNLTSLLHWVHGRTQGLPDIAQRPAKTLAGATSKLTRHKE